MAGRRLASGVPRTSWIVALGIYVLVAAAAYGRITRPEYRFRIGRVALERDDLGQSQHEETWLLRDPAGRPYGRLLEGKRLFRQQIDVAQSPDLKQVLQAYSDGGQFASLRALSLVWMGQALLSAGDLPHAGQALAAGIEADRSISDAYWLMGNVLFREGQFERAILTLEQAGQLNPHDPRPHHLIGRMFAMQKQLARAEAHYRQSQRLNPRDPDLLADLAECLADQGNSDGALELLTSVASTPRVLCLRAQCEFQAGRSVEANSLVDQVLMAALPAYTRMLTHTPEHLRALRLKARIETDLGNPAGAAEALQRIAEAEPVDPDVREELAHALVDAGKDDLAREQAAEAQSLRTQWANLAEMEQEFKEHRDDADLAFRMALLCRELKRQTQAENLLRAALAIDPQHAEAKAALEGTWPSATTEQKAAPK